MAAKELAFSPESTGSNMSLSLTTPIYSLSFLPSASDTDPPQLVLGGGGGSSKTGVKNKIASLKLVLDEKPPKAILKDAHLFGSGEDAPMSLYVSKNTNTLVCGVNGTEEALQDGSNRHLRVFSLSSEAGSEALLTSSKDAKVFDFKKTDEYQKSTAVSPDGKLLAIGSTSGLFSVVSYPELKTKFSTLSVKKEGDESFAGEEVSSVDFSSDSSKVLALSSSKILIYSTTNFALLRKIPSPSLSPYTTSLRSARFGNEITASVLFVAVNATSTAKGVGRKKKVDAKSFVSAWNTQGSEPQETDWVMTKSKTIGKRPVTSFAVSPDGKFLGVGTADLSITLLSAENLRPLLTVLNAHEGFPSTDVAFSPASAWVASASADGSVRIISTRVPGTGRWWTILVTILLLIVALIVQFVLEEETVKKGREWLHL